MIKKLTALFKRQPICPTQHPYATATSPDQIIAEAMKVSMAKDLQGWRKDHGYIGTGPHRRRRDYHRELFNKDRSLVLSWYDCPYSGPERFQINGTDFDQRTAVEVLAAFNALTAAYAKAEATARKAKLAMEANENKWNLAESLLGLKRNEFGALEPAEKVAA